MVICVCGEDLCSSVRIFRYWPLHGEGKTILKAVVMYLVVEQSALVYSFRDISCNAYVRVTDKDNLYLLAGKNKHTDTYTLTNIRKQMCKTNDTNVTNKNSNKSRHLMMVAHVIGIVHTEAHCC